MIIIDVGCGRKKQEAGSIGLDREHGSLADVICELTRFPWPIRDGCADRIHLSHFLEHQPDILRVMAEVHRIAKAGAEVLIVTPHFSSRDSYTDPTHLFHLGFHTFDYFDRDSFDDFSYHCGGFRIVQRGLTFGGNWLLDNLGRLFAAASIEYYEKHLTWIFPARNLFCRLSVLK